MADEPAADKPFSDDDLRSEWDRAPDEVKLAIERAVEHGTPALSVAFYARWWQLETWLRQLIYLEFRAKWGVDWAKHLVPSKFPKSSGTTAARATKDASNAYTATPDTTNVMSYIDVGVLFEVTDEHWALFEPSLLPKKRWDGWAEEIQQLRHRSAHCRRPHSDDLSRIELLLRDLERGAWNALTAHNVDYPLERVDQSDPVVAGWINKEHEDAQLVDHGSRVRGVELRLTWSKRPWATYENGETITGREGFFIHATFHLQRTHVLPLPLWHQFRSARDPVQLGLVYLLATRPTRPPLRSQPSTAGTSSTLRSPTRSTVCLWCRRAASRLRGG